LWWEACAAGGSIVGAVAVVVIWTVAVAVAVGSARCCREVVEV